MLQNVLNPEKMDFLEIEKKFPNDYILVKIIETDDYGDELAIIIRTSSNRESLYACEERKEDTSNTTILTGNNLQSVLLEGFM